jgi:hypothetical protein
MPTRNSNKPCTVHTWISTTADGWRMCSRCKQAQRILNGEWTLVTPTLSSLFLTRRTRTRQTVLEDRKTPKGKHIQEGFYIDHARTESNIQQYWGA